ncbi:MAG TPA: molybdate ABC transporter substrate-binding protein [Terriglobales bacterium]|jgi:molybdate transport system substrate-binding protein|nr:molybdate ABC transporter substrate-binding protein [Terriglobales bacterium]
MSFKKTLFSIALIFCTVGAASAQELHVAAAADLNFALPEIAKAFEAQTGTKVLISFGSSGNFFAQIQSGAPFDVFCSADMGYPQKLAAAGQALPETLRQYASGRLVLWVPSGSKLNFERDGIKVLLDPSVKKIAIANPEHAPYGRAAVAALQKAKLYDQVKEKLVLGENVSQTAQFVTSGNADIGLISLSLAQAPELQKQGHFWKVPPEIADSLPQGGIVLKQSASPQVAEKFLDYLSCPAGAKILAQYGFDVTVSGNSDPQKCGELSGK